MAEAWQLAAILTGVVVIVGIIALWWRRAMTARDRTGNHGTDQDR